MSIKKCTWCGNTDLGGFFGNIAFKCPNCGIICCGACVKHVGSTRCPNCEQKLSSGDKA